MVSHDNKLIGYRISAHENANMKPDNGVNATVTSVVPMQVVAGEFFLFLIVH